MTPGQQPPKTVDYLSKLNIQQLNDILWAEMESEETDLALIKNVTAVLESKTETKECDVTSSYQEFLSEYAGTEPLYDEVLEEMSREPKKKRPRARRAFRAALIAAVAAVFLLGGTVAAGAMGFNIWGAMSRWTEKHFGFSTSDSMSAVNSAVTSDPLAGVRAKLVEEGVTDNIVPNYITAGFELKEFKAEETFEGSYLYCNLANGNEQISISYLISLSEPVGQYPKDDVEPELYVTGGIEHHIMSNEGEYFAIWINENITCNIAGVSDKEELLKIIDSIY